MTALESATHNRWNSHVKADLDGNVLLIVLRLEVPL